MILKGKVVVVTGSSSGLGLSVANCFAELGAHLIITSRSNVNGGQGVVNQITESGGGAEYIQADLTNKEDVKRLFDVVMQRHSTIDILVNNAGRANPTPLLEGSGSHWLEQIETNLMTTVLCSLAVAPIMVSQGRGSIVNVASVRGVVGGGRPAIGAYAAAKAGVISFTQSLAQELAPRVMVNAIAPGIMQTPYLDSVSSEQLESWRKHILCQRFAEPREVAAGIIYLATSTFLTGSVLLADGGMLLGG